MHVGTNLRHKVRQTKPRAVLFFQKLREVSLYSVLLMKNSFEKSVFHKQFSRYYNSYEGETQRFMFSIRKSVYSCSI